MSERKKVAAARGGREDVGGRDSVVEELTGKGVAGNLKRIKIAALQKENAPSEIEVVVGPEALGEIILDRKAALTRVHDTLDVIVKDIGSYFPKVPVVMPRQLQGQLLNPDGTSARLVSVTAQRPAYAQDENVPSSSFSWPNPNDVTDENGFFTLELPSIPLPKSGLTLLVRGGNTTTEVLARSVDVADGKLGMLVLDRAITPLPRSIISQLKDVVPDNAEEVDEHPEEFAEPQPGIRFGEGDCARSFHSNSGVIDRFSYSILIRLIEPQVSPKQLVLHVRNGGDGDGRSTTPIPLLTKGTVRAKMDSRMVVDFMDTLGKWKFVDRVPIDRPVDITQFYRNVEEDPLDVPKAASLGLGYIVRLHQVWIPAGLSLGDLLYSLPLAPGEEQRIAVYERSETLRVSEAESFSIDEAQRFSEAADSSTLATFSSAYRESASGGSSMHTESDSWSVGGAGGIGGFVSGLLFGVGAAGGYGSSSSSGSTSSWQKGSKDFVSNASQDFHSRLSRQATAARRSSRTGIKLATSAERETVTTKVIANHNHCHALTVQYWEVLRHYSVSSQVDDIQLVCFVPLEIVQFLPPGQPLALGAGAFNRNQLLARYAMLLHYLDVLYQRMQRRPEYIHGLNLLKNFAANPLATVQSSTGTAQEVVSFTVTGTFLPFEDLFVTLVSKNGMRVGPIKLIGASTPIAPDTYTSADELLQHLRQRRSADTGEARSATIILPDYIARTDVVRFEISRIVRPFSYKLKMELPSSLSSLLFSDFLRLQMESTASYSAAQLEQLVGGPYVWDVRATIQGSGEVYANLFSGRAAAELMGGNMLPVPALRVPPVLLYADLLRVEAVFQHVVRNTVSYSKAVWMSLTPEERAILLERYTIGVPSGGITDASQEVPLLNCVANEVLGYFGNCMIMPFHIPPPLAEKMGVTSRDVQEALLKFHRQAFAKPRTSITLPTRGMLGEAVLGGCNSCEKIDITRFWNWKDSPIDKVEMIKPNEFKGLGLVGQEGAKAPSSLVPTSPMTLMNISTGQNVPAPSSNLLEQMMGKVPQPTAFADITGMGALKEAQMKSMELANTARQNAMETAKSMAEKVVDKLPDMMKAEAEAKEKAKKEAADEKKEAATAQTEKEKKTLEARKAKLDDLAANAALYASRAGAEGDATKAKAWASSLLKALELEPKDLSLPENALLFGKYQVGDDDKDAVKLGKEAFLAILLGGS